MIDVGGDGRVWLLSGTGSSYALRLTERDELLHLHWGPRITLADAEALAAEPLPGYRGFESLLDGREEYPVEGGPRFVRPALTARTEAVRGTEWIFEEYEVHEGEAGGDELRLHFHDAVHHVDIALHYRLRTGTDVIERWATVSHGGGDRTAPVELLRADAAAWSLP
ncbi:MAG: alpha-galactosidase, partial [Streptomyces sp.]|nr:alpha-galactosidase [Streptomyces sp.]